MSLQYVEDLLQSEFSEGGFFYEARHWNLDLELAYVALDKLDKITADDMTVSERMQAAHLIYDWPFFLQAWIHQKSIQEDFDATFNGILREIHRIIGDKMKLLLASDDEFDRDENRKAGETR
jgi:hypothetical protein